MCTLNRDPPEMLSALNVLPILYAMRQDPRKKVSSDSLSLRIISLYYTRTVCGLLSKYTEMRYLRLLGNSGT